jgi:hypothetical protein
MSFQLVRLSVANTLGFETFVKESLHDSTLQYAFLVPHEVCKKVAEEVRDFLHISFMNHGYRIVSTDWFDEGMYEYGQTIAHLERHWLFEVEASVATELPLPKRPICDRWVVSEVPYNSVKPDGCDTDFKTILMAATTPTRFQQKHADMCNYIHHIVCEGM